MIVKGYLFSIIYGLLCILISGVAHKLGLKTVYTRKITHILIGFEWVILYHYFGTSLHFLIVCLVFSLLLSISYVKKLFPQISSDESNSPGTIYYCIAMTLMSIVAIIFPDMAVPFGIGVFCTSFGDGMAGVLGHIKKCNKQIYGEKTIFGTLACFVFSLASTLLISYFYELGLEFYQAVIIAIFAAELELFSKRGIDNITVTLGASALAFAFANFPTLILNYVVPIILTLPIVVLVHTKKALTMRGIVFAIILDVLASIAFGNVGFLILILFFGGSLAVDELKKQKILLPSEKRNEKQVFANGFVGAILAIVYIVFPNEVWYIAFAASFAEALADTTASGIGAYSKKTYDPFHRKSVEQGISGGMSIIGTVSSLFASALMALLALIFNDIGIIGFCIIAISGFLGNIFDSFLGSILQVKYECIICGKITEKKIHCNNETKKHSGLDFVDNNVVNFLGTAFSAFISILLFFILN